MIRCVEILPTDQNRQNFLISVYCSFHFCAVINASMLAILSSFLAGSVQ